MPLARLLPFDQIERVADLRQVGGGQLGHEHVRSGPSVTAAVPRSVSRRCRWMLSSMVRMRARSHAPGQHQPDADRHEIDGRHAAHVQLQAGQHEKALRQQAEHDGTDTVGDRIDDDVDGVLDRRPTIGGSAGRARRSPCREPQPWSRPLVSSTLQNAGASRMKKLPVASASGRARWRPKRPTAEARARSRTAARESCRRRVTKLEQTVELGDVRGAAGEMVLRDDAELQRRPLGRDRDREDDAREQTKIGAGADLLRRRKRPCCRPPRRLNPTRRMRSLAVRTMAAADAISSASTSSRLTVPPTGSTSTLASTPRSSRRATPRRRSGRTAASPGGCRRASWRSPPARDQYDAVAAHPT